MFLRIKEQLRNGELPMSGDLWPTFVYKDYKVDPDDIWANLFRSSLLVAVRRLKLCFLPFIALTIKATGVQIHIYLPQLRRKGSQGYSIRKRPHSRHERGDFTVDCIRSYPSERTLFTLYNKHF